MELALWADMRWVATTAPSLSSGRRRRALDDLGTIRLPRLIGLAGDRSL